MEKLSLKDINTELPRVSPPWVIKKAYENTALKKLANSWEVDISREDLLSTAEQFRLENDLYTSSDMEQWLAERNVSRGDWESEMKTLCIQNKLLNSRPITEKVEETFEANNTLFSNVQFLSLQVFDQAVAHELESLYSEQGFKFDVLVHRYSVESNFNGEIGTCYKRSAYKYELPKELSNVDHAGDFPQIFGPFNSENRWHLFLMFSIDPPILDDNTIHHVKSFILKNEIAKRYCFSD